MNIGKMEFAGAKKKRVIFLLFAITAIINTIKFTMQFILFYFIFCIFSILFLLNTSTELNYYDNFINTCIDADLIRCQILQFIVCLFVYFRGSWVFREKKISSSIHFCVMNEVLISSK